jgi:hypothetical protein
MKKLRQDCSPSRWGFARAVLAIATIPGALVAQTSFQLGTVYQCGPGRSFKVVSCAGPANTDVCDVQLNSAGQASQPAKLPRQQVVALLPLCHVQTPQDVQADAHPPARPPSQASSNGIKVGDAVEVVTGSGWTPAKVVAINGNSYRVVVYGVQVTKDYPAEVRRVGGASAQDHANGQYRLGDRVQVNVGGQWVDAKIVTEMGMEYQVELPGNRTAWANPQNLRPGAPAPAAAAPKAGVPPKPGMTSCAGKVEGRYATTGNFGAFQITFRSGKATMTDVGGNDEVFECWMGDGKILLHQPAHANLDMPIDLNNDGTLQTPLGEIKKKGN